MRFYLISICFLWIQTAFCQDTYYKSSIITLKNDTIKGFISNIYDAKTISFKKKKNDVPTTYTPQLLRGYILDGNVFETHIVNIPFYKTRTATSLSDIEQRLHKDVDKGRIRDTFFLHKIVKGAANCYKMSNADGFTYYFIERNGILKELPPVYAVESIDSKSDALKTPQQVYSTTSVLPSTYITLKYDFLDTLAFILNDRTFVTLPYQAFHYSEKSLSSYTMLYNKRKSMPSNGGQLKTKVSRKIFTGISIGTLYLQYDDKITDAKVAFPVLFRLYGLYPLLGVNRNVFAKFAFNYASYSNDYYKRSIPSGSFGLRYSSISGPVRPYVEGSVGIAAKILNNRPKGVDYPLLLEGGVNIPVKNFFITVGATLTPVLAIELNGYKFAAFHIGVLF